MPNTGPSPNRSRGAKSGHAKRTPKAQAEPAPAAKPKGKAKAPKPSASPAVQAVKAAVAQAPARLERAAPKMRSIAEIVAEQDRNANLYRNLVKPAAKGGKS